eukprot:606741-Prymnesium_polylepis.1
MRIASKEADVDRVGYLYYGSQALGNYMQWPGIDWCPASYDPRYRNWYTVRRSATTDTHANSPSLGVHALSVARCRLLAARLSL